MADSVEPDRMLHSAASDRGLHCSLVVIFPNILGYYGMYMHVYKKKWYKIIEVILV